MLFRALVAASAVAIPSVADAGLMISQIARFADANGVTDRFAGAGFSVVGFDEPIVSVTRPNGSTASQQQIFSGFSSSYTAAEVNAWLMPRVRGTWTLGYEDGSTETIDTTNLWVGAEQQAYGLLTQQSLELWNAIVTQQLSGTFTFEMTQTVQQLGCRAVQIELGGGLGGQKTILSGSTFTLAVDGAGAAQGGFLGLSGQGVTVPVFGSLGYEAQWQSGFYTLYDATVPAPGVLALVFGAMPALRAGRRR